jgi:hypothetical protein
VTVLTCFRYTTAAGKYRWRDSNPLRPFRRGEVTPGAFTSGTTIPVEQGTSDARLVSPLDGGLCHHWRFPSECAESAHSFKEKQALFSRGKKELNL